MKEGVGRLLEGAMSAYALCMCVCVCVSARYKRLLWLFIRFSGFPLNYGNGFFMHFTFLQGVWAWQTVSVVVF